MTRFIAKLQRGIKMKIGFVFPGQGSQNIGMGKDIFDSYSEYRNLYNKAKDILNIDIANLTFRSSEEELAQTKNTQISILLMSLGILEILKNNNIHSEYLAGLSLGEYSALIYSSSFNFENGLNIVKKRGELMQENVPSGNWSMSAILGLEDEKVDKLCKEVSKYGFVVPANYNCPGQVVISGEQKAVCLAMEKAKELGCKKAIELKTNGPFHTEKLQIASKKFKKELEKIIIIPPNKKVIKNINAELYTKTDNMVSILSNHIISPVKFSNSIKELINLGVDTFAEIGPGKTLSGFIKKINPSLKILNTYNKENLENTIKFINNTK